MEFPHIIGVGEYTWVSQQLQLEVRASGVHAPAVSILLRGFQSNPLKEAYSGQSDMIYLCVR